MKKQNLLVITLLLCVLTLDAQWKQLPALKNLRIFYIAAKDNIILANAELAKEEIHYRKLKNRVKISKHIEYEDNLYFSSNAGKSWNDIPDSLLDASQVRGLLIVNNTIIIATTSYGVLISRDTLKSLSGSNIGLPFRSIKSICKSKDVIYVSSLENNCVYSSEDECKTWRKCSKIKEPYDSEFNSFANFEKILINRKINNRECIINSGYNGSWKVEKDLFSSETLFNILINNSECALGLPLDDLKNSKYSKIPRQNCLYFKNENIYVATDDGLFLTKNLQNWVEIPTDLLPKKNITAITVTDDNIFLAIKDEGIFKMNVK
ncbi:MAG: hypothetical protein NTW25_11155 [Candidatus Kapabacteria bacterium]|nr:hypothetical protein [Candidatus Kapabacteria bacterium]